LPRVNKRLSLVCVYSPTLNMFEVRSITKKGRVNQNAAPHCAFTGDVREAFRHFKGVPYASFRTVPGIRISDYKSWDEYIEAVWAAANPKANRLLSPKS
jgi:hypothetical protein